MKPYIIEDKFAKILISGSSGSGKTSIIKTLPNDVRILIYDFENGLLSINNFLTKNKDRIVVYTCDEGYSDIKKITALTNKDIADFDYIVIDSLTMISRIIEKHYTNSVGKEGELQIHHWKLIANDAWMLFSNLMSLECNVIFYAQTDTLPDSMGRRNIELAINGNDFKKQILPMLDFAFYLSVNEKKERFFITDNTVAISSGALHVCKKRDENNALEDVEIANLEYIFNKLNGVLQNANK
jgi:hypothetical protein